MKNGAQFDHVLLSKCLFIRLEILGFEIIEQFNENR